jgi:hypothetical protein
MPLPAINLARDSGRQRGRDHDSRGQNGQQPSRAWIMG